MHLFTAAKINKLELYVITNKSQNHIFEIKVEKDRYFVLGDNRVNSTDSRIIGTVSIKDIRGTTKLTIFPFGRFGNKN